MMCPRLSFYEPDYSLHLFVLDVEPLILIVVPAAIGVVLWKVFVTNRTTPRGNVLSLGLDETSATPTELYGRKIPWRALFLYASVGVTTFQFGVFIYETFYSIQEWFLSKNIF
ncbi:MAG TPA: hypothetical protein VGD41_12750 [Pyrinomonadaceae bacterium]